MMDVLLVAAATTIVSCGLPLAILYATPIAKRVDERSTFDPTTRRLLLVVSTVLIWVVLIYAGMHWFKPWAYHGILLGGLPLLAFGIGWALAWLSHFFRTI